VWTLTNVRSTDCWHYRSTASDPLRTLSRRGTIFGMLLLLATLLAAAPQSQPSAEPADIRGTAWVFSTIAQSEWCPAGNVMLDLRTGGYTLTPRAPRSVCHRAGLDRPSTRGRLQGRSLEAVRVPYLQAMRDGLANPDCQPGKKPSKFVISNGGTPVMVLTTGQGTFSAPDELSCWSDAADALHRALDGAFPSARQR
jgi:hypothetical protein